METTYNHNTLPRPHHHHANGGGFFTWLRHPQRGLPYLICSILVILVFLPFMIHYYLSNYGLDYDGASQLASSHPKADAVEEFGPVRTSDVHFQIQELKNIRTSVNNELLELEKKRQMLQSLVANYNEAIDSLKQTYQTTNQELDRLKVTYRNLQAEHDELLHNKIPRIEAPKRILPALDDAGSPPLGSTSVRCRLHSCFDYSRCSLTSQFPVYVYSPDENPVSDGLDSFIKDSVTRAFDASPHITYDPYIACLYVAILGDGSRNASLDDHLAQLPYWNNGANHLLINLARRQTDVDLFEGVNLGRALVASSSFSEYSLRTGFDVVLPPALGEFVGEVWRQLPLIVPARRKYLLTFSGEYISDKSKPLTFRRRTLSPMDSDGGHVSPRGRLSDKDQYSTSNATGRARRLLETEERSRTEGFGESDTLKTLQYFENVVVEVLKSMQLQVESDGFNFEFTCGGLEKLVGVNGEWALCGDEGRRTDLLRQSTFSLIVSPTNYSLVSTVLTQWRLYESLKSGAIPVFLGDYVRLPFDDVVEWSKVVFLLPKARITELHFFLRTFSDADILEMRRQGRLVFETYFGTIRSVVDTVLAVMRTRLKIPAFSMREEPSPSVFNDTFVPVKETVIDAMLDAEEILGPVEPPMNSPRYCRNFTMNVNSFLLPADPFHLYPFTPFEPVIPADAKFDGSSYGFRPIGRGVGGAGKEFGEALGGNNPREQFTVVILTYEREAVLINAVTRLKGLPHLNKVIVVWNNIRPPSEDLRWPDIGVEVHVIRTVKNSLNNRFLPYDAIKTEAVLSLDDDAHLRHDEIMFGFRIWREARDRIVGFPGRYNAWDLNHNSWLYNSNYSCELSMVLTGAAFFHKYYMFLYSYVMPQAIRDKVDEYLNCEDLAMNFLVAHVTRKPPIKVTSRWTFRCPGCPKALSVEDSHFQERHKCLNFFVQVYGYMPLLNTQYRADSVLFKTRIPHDKQKCFKFI